VAKGFTAHYERRAAQGRKRPFLLPPIVPTEASIKYNQIDWFILFGSLDELNRRRLLTGAISKKVKIEHPTDKGYFKEVYVLSKYGRRLLLNRQKYGKLIVTI
jgi:hypothetical protein